VQSVELNYRIPEILFSKDITFPFWLPSLLHQGGNGGESRISFNIELYNNLFYLDKFLDIPIIKREKIPF
jgi:hypothetical protein